MFVVGLLVFHRKDKQIKQQMGEWPSSNRIEWCLFMGHNPKTNCACLGSCSGLAAMTEFSLEFNTQKNTVK